uniref:Uncharacterized protein n=1 Tax=Setaria viridis TaxID=4556 RepID=A0A4U6TED1_SETVI|nr:hypothetical protein SEVIR_8G037650v2 [Setaria viridis]
MHGCSLIRSSVIIFVCLVRTLHTEVKNQQNL